MFFRYAWLDLARRVRDEFFLKKPVWPDQVRGLDTLMEACDFGNHWVSVVTVCTCQLYPN